MNKFTHHDRSFRVACVTLATIVSLTAANARGFNAQLQAQSFGSTNWTTTNPTGWQELDLIPTRVHMTGGPVNNQTITIQFDHTKSLGGRIYRGIQDLSLFTPSANVVITSGPTLSAPAGQDTWTYTFTVNVTDNAPADVEFRTRLAAGAHYFTGSSLQMKGSPSLGTLGFVKPAPSSGNPDLSVVKTGPTSANPGQTITYSLSYHNALNGSGATGVQIVDTLPAAVTFLNASNGGSLAGNTLTWDLGNLARGESGIVTYQVAVTNTVTTGFSFHNDAEINSAENDVNLSNNFSRVTTVVTSNCIPPSIVVGPADASSCGEQETFTVLANGSAPLSYQWRKDGEVILGATASQYSTSVPGSYDVVISNLCGAVTSAAATLTVGNPVIVSDPQDVIACLGASAAFMVQATGNALTYQWRKDGAAIEGATGSLLEIASATEADAGSYDVVVTGECGEPAVSAPATLTVKPAVVASNDQYEVAEDGVLSGNVLDNDSGQSLTAELVGSPMNGALSFNADGSFTYTPDPLFFGSDSFTYRAVGECQSEIATVSITVTHVNHAPVANDDLYGTLEDTALNISAPGVLGNDTDVDGDALEAVLVDGPSHGVLTLNADGSFGYTPATGFFGADSFTYQASDALAVSGVATVTVEVTHVNHAPVAEDDSLSIAENSGPHAIDVLANDSDVDAGDVLSITEITPPANGVAEIIEGGVRYTPNANFHGEDSFTYTISDGQGGAATATVTITVIHVEQAPVAQDDLYQVDEDDMLEVAAPGVLGNDINPEPTALTATLVTSPAHGSLTFHADGSFTYVPNDNYNGADSFTYKVNNSFFDSNVATVHINVLPVLGAGDIDLYVKTAKAKVNWADTDRDALAIRGQINPRGINDNLSGATIALSINDTEVLPAQTLDAKGVAKTVSGSLKAACRLKAKNGAYSIKISGADLRDALGLANQTQAGVTVVKVRLTINGAALEVPVTVADIEAAFKTTAGKASALKFNFRKNRTISGAFNANKTTGAVSSKGQTLAIKGVVTAEGGGALNPTGDITVHIGNDTMVIPQAMLSNNNGVWQYAGSGVAGLKKFVLSNATRSFVLSVGSGNIGLPAAGPGAPMKHDLPLQIQVPTADGTMVFESIIELKRTSETSTHWKR
jgi:uncharacterized repeat protein (TIGR01451 family)